MSGVIMLNGAFGVGKTTVAQLLRAALPGSVIYDPEWVGYYLRRLPRWVALSGAGTDDYQDIDLWRKSVVVGVRLFHGFARGPVIVPMTFTHRPYFDEIVQGIRRFDPTLRIFCLRASLPTLRHRLTARGFASSEEDAWLARRIVECAAAHQDPHFGESVETETLSAPAVAAAIITRLRSY